MTDLLLAVLVEMHDDAVPEGHRYEDGVLALLPRHGARLERRLRTPDGTTELQIIRFTAREGLDAFMSDPDRLTLRATIEPLAPAARVFEVADVVPPSRAGGA
ncbi:hypothetical protein [Catenuloplanes japonicus]|uniref:hypothetical protein n=1 Tax=Catenuloplanes japonicus TaxID=33876 RepID=UPI0005254E6A|nr:hypothetical protein [Catenuloplanes japonicus]